MRLQSLKFVDVDFRTLRPEWLLPNDNGRECISILSRAQKDRDGSVLLNEPDRFCRSRGCVKLRIQARKKRGVRTRKSERL